MTDQEKRGNVIKALELCTSKIETRTQIPCETCSYHNRKYHGVHGDGCCNMRSLQRDMLALLKAQEPHVMTLEEVKQWCEIHPHKQNPIWVEFQHGYGTNGWRVGMVNSGMLAWCKDNEARCWTSRPTDEQREKVKWE